MPVFEKLGLSLLIQLISQALGHAHVQQEQTNQALQALTAQRDELQRQVTDLTDKLNVCMAAAENVKPAGDR